MFSDNEKNQACEFAAETLEYLYGEIDGAKKTRVERHLSVCALCADDAAAFGIVRASLNDWKTFEFDKLPFSAAVPVSTDEKDISPASWAQAIRAYFSFPQRAFVVAALALTAVFGTAAFVYYNLPAGERQIAEKRERNTAVNSSPPVLQTPSPDETGETNSIKAEVTPREPAQTEKPEIEPAPATRSAPAKKAALNDAERAAPARKAVPSAIRRRNVAAPTAAKRPTLAGSSDTDEDDSLRLADIFEEISMR